MLAFYLARRSPFDRSIRRRVACDILEVRAVAARGIYESLTIHRLAVPVTQKGVSHNQSATEMVTSFGKAGTGYCAVIAGQTTVTTARLRQCDRGIITGYSISGH